MLEDDGSPPSSRDVANDDFLFHLYRGSELLLDNRVHEAKQELEQALGVQPRDAKGQDLLAIVYFRLGLYPRAIAIYEALLNAFPEATTPRINLALCYLKTGQPAAARGELERVLERNPEHARAWGYLGLAFQRMGDVERAAYAFQMGGHEGMARRITEAVQPSIAPEPSAAARAAAAETFEELGRRDLSFRPDPERQGTGDGTWTAVEPGRELPATSERRFSFAPAPAAPESLPPPGFAEVSPVSVAPAAMPSVHPSLAPAVAPRAGGTRRGALRDAEQLARDLLLVFPRGESTARHASGLVLVHQTSRVAARLDAVRSLAHAGTLHTSMAMRRTRGHDSEDPLGGVASPLWWLEGVSSLVLAPPPGTALIPVALGREALFVRESLLVAVEGDVDWENGRMPGPDGEAVPVVGLRGDGVATLALPPAATLEVSEKAPVLARAQALYGWSAGVTVRALPPSEAPARARGFVAVEGRGMVFVDAR